MKIINFLIYAILAFAVMFYAAARLKGGLSIGLKQVGNFFTPAIGAKEKFTMKDWKVVFVFAIVSGLTAGLATTSSAMGLIAVIVFLAEMAHVTYWGSTKAYDVKEVLTFIVALVPYYIAANCLAATAAEIIWSGFHVICNMALVVAITCIIALTLFYRSREAIEEAEELSSKGKKKEAKKKMEESKTFKNLGIGVIVVGAVIFVVLLF